MGCDGGTIPQRKEVVKQKSTEKRERDKIVDQAERWKICSLCDTWMFKPIVGSLYGYLMCKECALEYLIAKKQDKLSAHQRLEDKPHVLGPINSSKAIKDLKLKDNPDAKTLRDFEEGTEEDQSPFICPITGLTTNGSYRFMFSWNCGCVVSERAIKEVPNNDACLVCQKPYKPHDLILINPANQKELDQNQTALVVRKMALESKRIDPSPSIDPSSVNGGASTSKSTSRSRLPGVEASVNNVEANLLPTTSIEAKRAVHGTCIRDRTADRSSLDDRYKLDKLISKKKKHKHYKS